MPTSAQSEIEQGQRFAFGENWSAFLETLDQDRIDIAVQSLKDLLGTDSLAGKTFLDIGSGSGLFSLAARKLDAQVTSFDFDEDSVACTRELKRRYCADDSEWTIQQGSALDQTFLQSLEACDVVYSWGVLHHTGDMWQALNNTIPLVKQNGQLVIALYNDQGWLSKMWLRVKRIYCGSKIGKSLMQGIFYPYFFTRTVVASVVRGQNEFVKYRRHRGMSITHDWKDWLGGLPFEVASVDEVTAFFHIHNFELIHVIPTHGLGCHQFVFRKQRIVD